MPAGKIRRPGCENCRARHLKCDRSVPCAPCAKKGLTCQRPQRLRFSHSFYSNRDVTHIKRSTRKLQRAVQRQKIQFVDQTLETVRSYDIEVGDEDQLKHDGYQSENSLPDERKPTAVQSQVSIPPIDPSLTARPETAWPTPGLAILPDFSNQSLNNHDIISGVQTWCYENFSSGESPGIIGNSSSPLAPLHYHAYPDYCTAVTTSVDARLARNFLERVGPALDPWDECRGLAADMLEEAAKNPELLETALAASARHMVSTGILAEMEGDQVFQKRLRPPRLTARQPQGGSIPAACVALLQRTIHIIAGTAFEERNETIADKTWPIGTSPQQSTTPLESLESKLAGAALWQEAFLSVMYQRPITAKIRHACLNQDIQGNDDRTWATRIFMHLLDAIQYCFGEERSPATYDRLVSYLATWMESKPDSFRPIYIRANEAGAGFPEIWLLNSAVVAGLQWYHLVRILLLAHNPRLPQFGAAKRSAKRSRDDQIRDDVKIICGIAESIDETTSAHLTACMAISLVGDRFTVYEEQTALLNILATATSKFGWATASATQELKAIWGWKPDS